jgi:hypothetical protein
MGREGVDRISATECRYKWQDFLNNVVNFLIIKPTRCTNFSNLFLKWNSACFGQFLCPSSGVLTCICLSTCYFVWPWAPYRNAHVTSHRGHCLLRIRISCVTWRISKLLETLSFIRIMLHILLLCVSFFYVYRLYFINAWHVYEWPKTYTWSGTFILKDGRYTFTFFSLYIQQWYMSYRFVGSLQIGSGWNWSCSQAASKPVWHIPLLCVQWKTPDDRQRKCLKHVEFHFKKKFEKLVHLVSFIIRNLSWCMVTRVAHRDVMFVNGAYVDPAFHLLKMTLNL